MFSLEGLDPNDLSISESAIKISYHQKKNILMMLWDFYVPLGSSRMVQPTLC